MRFSLFSPTDHYPDLPRSIGAFYSQLLAEVVQAEQLGFDNFFVAEHHFHQYGIIPSPAVLLASAAQRTERIGLGTGIVPLPFHNPIRVAEDYAMVDVLSGGRLAFGIGSGYLPHEYSGFSLGPWEKRHRFDEAIEVIETAWRGERFTHHGLYYHFSDVKLNVTPIQRYPPTWVAILRMEAAYYVGRQGRNALLLPYASVEELEQLGQVAVEYRRGRSDGGHDPFQGDFTLTLHTYVTDDGRGLAEAREAIDNYLSTRLYARKSTVDDLDKKRLILFGSPEQIADRIVEFRNEGMNHLMACCNFGGLDASLVRRSMELLATEVVPLVQASARGSRERMAAAR